MTPRGAWRKLTSGHGKPYVKACQGFLLHFELTQATVVHQTDPAHSPNSALTTHLPCFSCTCRHPSPQVRQGPASHTASPLPAHLHVVCSLSLFQYVFDRAGSSENFPCPSHLHQCSLLLSFPSRLFVPFISVFVCYLFGFCHPIEPHRQISAPLRAKVCLSHSP